MTTENRSGYTAGLRQLADVLDAHPEIPLPYEGTLGEIGWYLHGDSQRDILAAIARGIPCRWDKGTWGSNGDGFKLTGELAGLKVGAFATRDQVCRKVVTGTEDREVEEVVTPAVTRKVTKPVEVVTWECLPLLAADASDVVESAIEADADGVADAVAEGIAAPDTAQPEDIPLADTASVQVFGVYGRHTGAVGAGDAQPEDIPTLTECTNCHLIGTPADMDPVTFATFEHGPGGTRWYCRDITACGTRARTAKAGAR